MYPSLSRQIQSDAYTLVRMRGVVVAIATLFIGVSGVSLGGCAAGTPSPAPPVQTSAMLRVVTTFLPISQFTKAVAKNRAVVQQLLPTEIGPHEYQARPNDVQKLAQADVLVENGLGFEAFLDDMVKNSKNPTLKIINSSQGIPTLANKTDLDHPDPDSGITESKPEHGEYNPHIWLDPKRVMQQVKTIRDGLIAADPDGKVIYTVNANAYLEQLQKLDAEITQSLKPHQGKTFVTYHDFAAYFANSYQLNAQFLVGIPEENASPQDVKRVLQATQKSHLKTLLTEPQALGNPFEALAKDLRVNISTFDPLETGGQAATEPDYYLTTMRQNLQHLKSAFGAANGQSQRE